MKKRIFAPLLALVMVLGMLPIAALAAEGYTITEVLPCKYYMLNNDETGFTGGPYFCEGLTIAMLDYKWGFIDSTGKEVVPCKYGFVENFSEGLAMVGLSDKGWGFIDKTGKEVIPLKYDSARNFSEGLAPVNVGCDYSGSGGRWSFIDKTGKEVELHTAEYDRVDGFYQGLAIVELNDKVGFIDKTGKEVVPCKYDKVRRFSEGLAAVWLKDQGWGFVDTTGKEVVPCKYTYHGYEPVFREGLAAVELDGKQGFIDKTGKEVVPCQYDSVDYFSEGLAAVKLNGKWGFVDTTGKEVVPCKYTQYTGYQEGPVFSEGLAAVELNGKWGFVDTTGKEVIPLKYDGAGAFSEGLAAVELNGKWGFVDTTGKEVIPLKYDGAGAFSEGLAAVELNDKWGFIDTTGKEVTPFKYDGTSGSFPMGFHEGFLKVCVDDPYDGIKWGLVDTVGKEAVPCQYDDVVPCAGGLVAVCNGAPFNDGKWGFISVTKDPIALTKSMFTVDAADAPYTGSPITKTVTGKNGTKVLVEGVDYTVTYADNTEVGTAKLTITGKGDYTGTLEYTFDILGPRSGSMGEGAKALAWSCTPSKEVRATTEALAPGEKVLAAAYDENGRLTAVQLLDAAAPAGKLPDGSDAVKLFWVNASQQPLFPAVLAWGQ